VLFRSRAGARLARAHPGGHRRRRTRRGATLARQASLRDRLSCQGDAARGETLVNARIAVRGGFRTLLVRFTVATLALAAPAAPPLLTTSTPDAMTIQPGKSPGGTAAPP